MIVGDSHSIFFLQKIKSDQDFDSISFPSTEFPKSGHYKEVIDDIETIFVWEIGKTAYNASYKYFKERFSELGNLQNIDYVFFQFGTVDLIDKAIANDNIETCIDRYVDAVISISKDYNFTPVIMKTILYTKKFSRKDVDRWQNYLKTKCEQFDILLFDTFKNIDENFIPQPGGGDHHFNKYDSAKSLDEIVEYVKIR